jgi:hypothetical protein
MAARAEATLRNIIDAGLFKPPMELVKDYKGAS